MTGNIYGDQDVDGAERSKQSLAGRVLYWILWRVFYAAILLMFRLRVEGRKNLPDGPFILCGNHRSFIDTPIIGMVTSRRLRFMGKESLWNSKPLGTFGWSSSTCPRAGRDSVSSSSCCVRRPEIRRRIRSLCCCCICSSTCRPDT